MSLTGQVSQDSKTTDPKTVSKQDNPIQIPYMYPSVEIISSSESIAIMQTVQISYYNQKGHTGHAGRTEHNGAHRIH